MAAAICFLAAHAVAPAAAADESHSALQAAATAETPAERARSVVASAFAAADNHDDDGVDDDGSGALTLAVGYNLKHCILSLVCLRAAAVAER